METPINSAWKSQTLGDVITLQRGFDLPSQDRREGPFPIVSSSGITGFHREFRVEGPGVVTGRYGTLGEVHYVDERYWPLNTTLFVRDFKDNDHRFIYYLLKSLDFSSFNDKSSVPGLNRNHLHQIPVTIPEEIGDQRAIAHILSTLDDKIELNRQMNQTLEQIAAALFTSWFVDFDPVRAKAAGRQPQGMDAATAALFPDRLVESELGEIPEGWDIVPVGDVVSVVGGSTPSTKELAYWNGDIPFATPKDLSKIDAPILLGTERHITESGLARISSGLIPHYSVLLSSRAPIGYLAINDVPVAVNQGMIVMICDKGVSPWYMLEWAQVNRDEFVGRANGTTFLEISKRNFRPIPVVLASKAALAAFDTIAESLFLRLVANLRETRILAELRDTLLPRLLSGELRVPLDAIDEETVIMPASPTPDLVQSCF